MDYEKAYKASLKTAAQWIKDGCTDKEKICLECVFPELRENEDERIRKLLVWQVYRNIEDETNDLAQSVYDGIKGHDPDIEESIEDWKKCLAYLEKQKPMYNLEIPAGDVAPAEEDGPFDEDEFLEGELSAFLQNYDKEYDDDAAVSDVAKHFYEIGKKQKENPKSADSIPEYCASNARCPYKIYGDEDFIGDIKDTPAYHFGFDEGVRSEREKQKEQKPIQTSEEKEYIRTLKSLISDFIRDKQPEDVVFYQKIYDWLDGRHIEQEPAEWSEDKFPKDIEKDATQFCFDKGINISPHQAKEIATHYLMLGHNEGYVEGRKNAHIPARELGLPKSMDFKQEWSEEDEKIRRNLMSLLVNMRGDRITEETYQKYYPWLKSLRPSWKPTYEQMEALRKAVNKLADTEVADSVRLSIMYDHLKELV